MWRVVTYEKQVIPPMSQIIIQGRLDAVNQDEAGNPISSTRGDIRKISIQPENVLIEPAEIHVHGIIVARVLSKVHTVDNNKTVVTVKLINFSKESLEVSKNSLLGIAEMIDDNPASIIREARAKSNTHTMGIVQDKDKRVNVVKTLIRCNDNAEFKVLKEFREKLRHLKNEVFHTLYTVLKKYKRLFVEPESMECKSSVKHKIVTGTYVLAY